jgi:hypothetical protein
MVLQIGTFLLAHVFSALLPPVDPNEDDLYEILGLEKDATNEQIRKAYKVQSLKLHPDKVAQRGNMNKEEAAAQYEKVQEAYGVLVNEEKRSKYHSLKCSSTRYRFVEQGGLANPGGLMENLSQATCIEKTRLVGLAWIIMLVILMQPILIGAKINQFLENDGPLADSSWAMILIPFWAFGALGILFWSALLYFSPAGEKGLLVVNVLEQLAWLLAIVFLVEKWDGWSASYRYVLIPVYVAMTLRWIEKLMTISKIRGDVARMVTMEFLETEVLKGKNLDDITTEEQEQLRKDYIIVTVPPEFEPDIEPFVEDGETPDDKLLEELKVEASHEYEAATEIYNSTLGSLYGSVIFGLTFLILLTLKLDDQISGNWWAVFSPIWIYLISQMVYSCFIFTCGTVSGDEIVLGMPDGEDDDDEDKEKPEDSAFIDPTTSTTDFNKSVGKDDPKQTSVDDKNDGLMKEDKPNDTKTSEMINANEEDAVEKDPSEAEGKISAEDGPPKDTKTPEKKDANNEGAVEKDRSKAEEKSSAKDGPPNVAGYDSDENIHIDEETFRAWQNAYVEAEKSAMEAQAKAATDCCILTFQLILLCLIVSKIERNYDDIDPDDVGFNVFWILSPLFFVFGCIGCCCACLIYGASSGISADLNGADQDASENVAEHVYSFQDPENPTPSNPTPIIVEPPKEEVPLQNTEPSTPEKSADESKSNDVVLVEQSADMEDLD